MQPPPLYIAVPGPLSRRRLPEQYPLHITAESGVDEGYKRIVILALAWPDDRLIGRFCTCRVRIYGSAKLPRGKTFY